MHGASLPSVQWYPEVSLHCFLPPHVSSDSCKFELWSEPGEISTGCGTPDRCSSITAEWIVDGLLWRHLWFHRLSLFVLCWRACQSPVWLMDFSVWQFWFYRLDYPEVDSFCSDVKRDLRRMLEIVLADMLSSLYVSWLTKGTVPLRVSVLLLEKYWLNHTDCAQSPNSFSQWALLCGSWGDKTCCTMKMASFPQKLGRYFPIHYFPICIIHSQNKVCFNPPAEIWDVRGTHK